MSQKFTDVLLKQPAASVMKLKGKYDTLSHRLQVARALRFWNAIFEFRDKLIREYNMDDRHPNYIQDAYDVIRKELKCYLDDTNPYLALVAKIESLPTPVLRRTLWHYNIDFNSFESMLRRMTDTQVEGIKQTYDCLYASEEPSLPLCFIENWQNKVRNKLKITDITLKNIMEERFTSLRYHNKGSIAYEFFGLEMGFGRFMNEETDDEIPLSQASRFLNRSGQNSSAVEVAKYMVGATKNSDYCINREDGLYNWLYTTLRSNYMWNSNSNVRIKNAVCPGFWITVFAWIFLIVISPIFSVVSSTAWLLGANPIFGVVSSILGVVTPLILLYGLSKYLLIRFLNFIDKELDVEYFKLLREFIAIACIGAIICGVSAFLSYVFYYWNNESYALSAALTCFVLFYVVLMFHNKTILLPTSVPIFGIPVTVFLVAKILIENYVHIFSFFGFIFATLYSWIYVILAVVLYLALVGGLVYLICYLHVQKKETVAGKLDTDTFDKVYDKLTKWIYVVIGVTAVVVFTQGYYNAPQGGEISSMYLYAGLFFVALPIGLALLFNLFYSPKYVQEVVTSRSELLALTSVYDTKSFVRDILTDNRWLMKQDNKQELVENLLNFMEFLEVSFYSFSTRYKNIAEALPYADEDTFTLIDEYKQGVALRDEYWYVPHGKDLLTLLLAKVPYSKAEEIIEHKSKKGFDDWYLGFLGRCYDFTVLKYEEKLLELKRLVSVPFVFIRDSLQKMYVFYKAFNERCPTTMEPRSIRC